MDNTEIRNGRPDNEFSIRTPQETNFFWDIPPNSGQADKARRIGLEAIVSGQHGTEIRFGNDFFIRDGNYDMKSLDGKYHLLSRQRINGLDFLVMGFLPIPYGINDAARQADSIRDGEYALLIIRGPHEWHGEAITAWNGGTVKLVKAVLSGTPSDRLWSPDQSDGRVLTFVDPETADVIIPDWRGINNGTDTYAYMPVIGILESAPLQSQQRIIDI